MTYNFAFSGSLRKVHGVKFRRLWGATSNTDSKPHNTYRHAPLHPATIFYYRHYPSTTRQLLESQPLKLGAYACLLEFCPGNI